MGPWLTIDYCGDPEKGLRLTADNCQDPWKKWLLNIGYVSNEMNMDVPMYT